jgi:hypothetical protein
MLTRDPRYSGDAKGRSQFISQMGIEEPLVVAQALK